MTDIDELPVPAYIVVNLLVAAHQLFREHHHAMGQALLVKAEDLAPRVVDPVQYLSLVNQLDKLWKTYHVETGLVTPKPRGLKTGRWQQIDLPFSTEKPS